MVEVTERNAPSASEALVRMEYAPIEYNDLLLANGMYFLKPRLRGIAKLKNLFVVLFVGLSALVAVTGSGCGKTEAKDPAPQPLPVNTQTVCLTPVPRVDEYVATVKSRRSATIQPQVDGSL